MLTSNIIFLVTEISTPIGFAIICGTISLLLFSKTRYKDLFIFLLSLALTATLAYALKTVLAIERPPNALIDVDGFGFPSGHATGAMFLATAIYLLYLKRARPIFKYISVGILILGLYLIGASRLAIGVHTFPQVLGGYVLGFLVPVLVFFFLSRLRN